MSHTVEVAIYLGDAPVALFHWETTEVPAEGEVVMVSDYRKDKALRYFFKVVKRIWSHTVYETTAVTKVELICSELPPEEKLYG